MECGNEYKQKLRALESLGGDITRNYKSVYEIDLEILRIISSQTLSPMDANTINVLKEVIKTKQDILTPGNNISIEDNVISVTGLTGDGGCCINDDDSGSTETTYSASKIETAIQNQLGEFADRLADTEETLINERIGKIIDDKYELEDYTKEGDETNKTLPTNSTLSTQKIYDWLKKNNEIWDSALENLINTSINDYESNLKQELEEKINSEIEKSKQELQKSINEKVNGGNITNIWVGRQEEYNEISSKDSNTLYIVK